MSGRLWNCTKLDELQWESFTSSKETERSFKDEKMSLFCDVDPTSSHEDSLDVSIKL